MRQDTNINELIMKSIDIPSIPPVASKVLQLAQSSMSNINELTNIINEDSAFALRVLRTANSPYFGRSREIKNIHTAIMVIGFNTMKSLVVAAAMKDLYTSSDNYIIDLWSHHLGVSIAASILANKSKLISPEEAHIAGLVHDIGNNVMHKSIASKYLNAISLAYKNKRSIIEIENSEFGFNHCDVGLMLAEKWKLPEIMTYTMGYHHYERFSAHDSPLSNTQKKLCEIISIADNICFDLDIGYESPPSNVFSCLSDIGLDISTMQKIKDEVYLQYKNAILEIHS